MSPAPTRRNVLGLLGAFVATAVVAGLLVAGLVMPAVGASGVATKQTVNLFNSLPSDLQTPTPPQRSTLEDADGHTIAQFYDENRTDVPITKIAPVMQKAIVAIEDSRFYEHGGVDPKGLLRAFAVNQINGGVEQGASTITQQYVKNQLVENATVAGDKAAATAARAKSNSRKLQEIRYAITIEKKLSKQEILDRYLNIVLFGGSPPVYGIQAAAKHYFNEDASKLTLPQAAMLAGMVQNPSQWDPVRYPKNATIRRNTVLARMYQLHVIDQPTYAAAVKTKIKLHLTNSSNGCANASPSYSAYFCQYVYNYITKNKTFSSLGSTEKERENTVQTGGLVIKTTLDPKIEKTASKTMFDTVPASDSKNATAAVTIQPGTGKVLAMAQDRYFAGGKGTKYQETNWSVDYEYGNSGGFQVGSSFKPYTLAQWLKDGHSLNDVVSEADGTFAGSDFKSCQSLAGVTWHPLNSEGKGSGSGTVLKATAASINTAYAHMEMQLNLCDLRNTAESMGVYRAKAIPAQCGDTKAQAAKLTTQLAACQPSMTLGVNSESVMTQANGYATFAAQGKYCEPLSVTSISGPGGKTYSVPGESCKQVLDKKVANTVTYALTKVLQAGGTAAAVGPLSGRPTAGKTGTTNGGADTWFVGYTPQASTAVWVGNIGPLPRSGVYPGPRTINGRYYRELFGAQLAAPAWKKIMETAESGLPVVKFGEADSKLTNGATTGVPNVAGESVSDAVSDLNNAGFNPNVGGLVNSSQPSGKVAYTSPAAGSQVKAGTTVTISISSGSNGGNNGNNAGKNGGKKNGGGNNNGLGTILGGLFPPPGTR